MLIKQELQSNVKTDNATGSGFEPTGFDAAGQIATFLDKPTGVLTQLVGMVKESLGPGAYGKAIADLDAKAAALTQVLGVGQKRGAELTMTIADTIPKYMELGLKASDVTDDYKDLVNAFNVNLNLTDDQLVELAATAKVTGQEGKVMAKAFQDAGAPISTVGDKMMDVITIANQAGVTVGAVSAGVVGNLDKMSLYNFEGGVKGLAKMAAQAARLGINMESIFKVTEDVFNPEGAIELASSLQRLGVQTSALLDPLKLMDLAQNDPTELQNQIVGMTKQFTMFNEETKQFEILPGAKRQMNEVAKSLGMTGGEFQKMALNAANFDQKLKQIKFSPDIKEEDRELVATMAQINKEGVAEVKIMRKDEEGRYTGEYDMVKSSELTADQITAMKEQQEFLGKNAEEIAKEQLSELQLLNTSIDRFTTSITYGIASSPKIQSTYKDVMGGVTGVVKKGEGVTTESVRGNFEQTMDAALKMLEEGYKILDEQIGITKLFEDWGGKITSTVSAIPEAIESVINSSPIQGAKNFVQEQMENIIGEANNNNAAPKTTEPTKIELAHTFNFSNMPDYLTSSEATTMFKQYFENPITAFNIVNKSGTVNSGIVPPPNYG